MDTAKRFTPNEILLWRQVVEHPEAERIVQLFPSARVRLIEHQRMPADINHSPGQSLIHGKRTLMVGATNSFVGDFDGRPGDDVHCLPYRKLVPVSNGCPYFCTYCYLAFVYRNHAPCIKVNVNHDTMFKQIRRAIARAESPVCFSMGEMLDSLALDHITELTSQLVPFFEHLRRGYLILLTKSTNISNLLELTPNDHTIVSWSLNTDANIRAFELATPPLAERIEAARHCRRHGYRVRIRIDPGILSSNWPTEYAELIYEAVTAIRPEGITLGMLRLLPGHRGLASTAYRHKADALLAQRLPERASDGKYRYNIHDRLQFYRHLIGAIRDCNRTVPISLCRETPAVWRQLTDVCEPRKCNCLVW